MNPADDAVAVSPSSAIARRQMLLLGVTATVWLAGCASKPATTTQAAAASAPRRRASLPGAAGATDTGVVPINLGLSGELREALYARVMLVVNTPYTYGGNTPEGGFDCSGLIQYAIAGITTRKLPRTTSQWVGVSASIDRAELQRGDFVFFNTLGGRYSHMGIYAGNNQFVHAPSSGGVVKTVGLDNPYFAKRFTEARTIFDA